MLIQSCTRVFQHKSHNFRIDLKINLTIKYPIKSSAEDNGVNNENLTSKNYCKLILTVMSAQKF